LSTSKAKKAVAVAYLQGHLLFPPLFGWGLMYEWLGNISRVDDLLSSKQARKVNDILDVLSLN
jgi:hypothetical protein